MMAKNSINVCGEVCPMPVLRTKNALEEMKTGEILEVITDYPPSKENIQRFVVSQGNKVLKVDEQAEIIKLLIEKA
jgi:tRNA 2-thiouridine synthesizing protein A